MAKRKQSSLNYCRIFVGGTSITRNGKTVRLPDINYERVERDGKVTETGKPKGLPADAGVNDVIRHAIDRMST